MFDVLTYDELVFVCQGSNMLNMSRIKDFTEGPSVPRVLCLVSQDK